MKVALVSSSLAALALAPALSAQISIASLEATYSQDFNTLSTSGSSNAWTDNSTLSGWYASHATYAAGAGGIATSGMYALGAGGGGERAFGGLPNTSTPVQIALRLVNNTGQTITSFDLAYTGEQWRQGPTLATTISVAYQTFSAGTGSISAGSWAGGGASLTFTPTTIAGTEGAISGNAAGNFASLSGTLLDLNWAAGDELWIRWTVAKASGSNIALGVDDVALSNFSAVPEPSSFAALAGLAALAGTGLRRHRRAA